MRADSESNASKMRSFISTPSTGSEISASAQNVDQIIGIPTTITKDIKSNTFSEYKVKLLRSLLTVSNTILPPSIQLAILRIIIRCIWDTRSFGYATSCLHDMRFMDFHAKDDESEDEPNVIGRSISVRNSGYITRLV